MGIAACSEAEAMAGIITLIIWCRRKPNIKHKVEKYVKKKSKIHNNKVIIRKKYAKYIFNFFGILAIKYDTMDDIMIPAENITPISPFFHPFSVKMG